MQKNAEAPDDNLMRDLLMLSFVGHAIRGEIPLLGKFVMKARAST